jgi:hypothetical protein
LIIVLLKCPVCNERYIYSNVDFKHEFYCDCGFAEQARFWPHKPVAAVELTKSGKVSVKKIETNKWASGSACDTLDVDEGEFMEAFNKAPTPKKNPFLQKSLEQYKQRLGIKSGLP